MKIVLCGVRGLASSCSCSLGRGVVQVCGSSFYEASSGSAASFAAKDGVRQGSTFSAACSCVGLVEVMASMGYLW